MKNLRQYCSLLFLFLLLTSTYGQEEKKNDSLLYHIETVDGNEFTGSIISEDNEKILLKTNNLGTITILSKDIRKVTRLEPKLIKNGEVWLENHQATRYFWQPNGYGLKKGEGYYQNIWVMFSQASVGLTDNISFGAGMVPLFLFQGPTPIWFTPKISVPVVEDKFNVGGGVLFATLIGEGGGSLGIAYGVATFGNRDTNANFGIGYGFADGEWANSPMITFSAMARTGRRGYFLTENYYIGIADESFGVISLGGRTVWPRISIDYGGIIPLNLGSGLIVIPWLGFSIPLGS